MDMEKERPDQKVDQENIIKITVTKEAGEILADLVVRANEGFEGGKINRQNLASYVIEKFKNNFSDKDLAQLRQLHYDDAAMLEAMYRKMKETGDIPDFLREALKKQFHGIDDSLKRTKKSLTKEYINDVQSSDGETT
ncbi:MAG: hypothetical protein J0L82_18535 [Deltaproteobacteria bacterium]|nr:hypothetical protein [Deltaproteobacteria bacterium]